MYPPLRHQTDVGKVLGAPGPSAVMCRLVRASTSSGSRQTDIRQCDPVDRGAVSELAEPVLTESLHRGVPGHFIHVILGRDPSGVWAVA